MRGLDSVSVDLPVSPLRLPPGAQVAERVLDAVGALHRSRHDEDLRVGERLVGQETMPVKRAKQRLSAGLKT